MRFLIPKIFKPSILPLTILLCLFSIFNTGLGNQARNGFAESETFNRISSLYKHAINKPNSESASNNPFAAFKISSTAVNGFPPKDREITSIVGQWSGDLDVGGMRLKLEFNIKQIDAQIYRSYLSVPQQGAKDLPMDKTEVSKTKITIKSNLIGAVFVGKWDENNRIEGEFIQNGQTFKLVLLRGGAQLNRPQTPQPPFPYLTRTVQFSNRQGTCRFQGTLTTPKSGRVKGSIILFSGSGAQNRDEEIFGHKPFAVLADTFTKAGYNVLRVDDRGAGFTVCKPSEMEQFTTQDLIEDGKAYLKFVQDSLGVNAPILLFGHSEGCSIAAALAKNNPQISKIIGFGPALVSGAEINTYQNQSGVNALLKVSTLTAQYLRLHRQILTLTQNEAHFNISSDSLKQYIEPLYAFWTKSTPWRYRKKIEKRFAKIAKTSFTDYLLKSYHPLFQNAWMWHFLNSNAREDWQHVSQPTLLINGSLDIQTPVVLNEPAFNQYLRTNTALEYTILPQINHLFQRAKTGDIAEYGNIETTVDAEVLRVIFKFLERD